MPYFKNCFRIYKNTFHPSRNIFEAPEYRVETPDDLKDAIKTQFPEKTSEGWRMIYQSAEDKLLKIYGRGQAQPSAFSDYARDYHDAQNARDSRKEYFINAIKQDMYYLKNTERGEDAARALFLLATGNDFQGLPLDSPATLQKKADEAAKNLEDNFIALKDTTQQIGDNERKQAELKEKYNDSATPPEIKGKLMKEMIQLIEEQKSLIKLQEEWGNRVKIATIELEKANTNLKAGYFIFRRLLFKWDETKKAYRRYDTLEAKVANPYNSVGGDYGFEDLQAQYDPSEVRKNPSIVTPGMIAAKVGGDPEAIGKTYEKSQ